MAKIAAASPRTIVTICSPVRSFTSPDTTNKDVGYILNPDYMKVGELIPMGTNSLPNLGGGERGFVDWTGTLIVNHPAAHGEIVGL